MSRDGSSQVDFHCSIRDLVIAIQLAHFRVGELEEESAQFLEIESISVCFCSNIDIYLKNDKHCLIIKYQFL